MSLDGLLALGREAMTVAGLVALPVLATALTVGVVVGLFQVLTQVQEATLSFVPKMLAVAAVAVLLGPWMAQRLLSFTAGLLRALPELVR
ncbi:MAG: flagellar biosynthetic protein FliQ [Armatimonadota bacterium]|nr:flagellar biosynthetic protein FliQ [Armatimonadota bacterium]MDR5675704.1 flagellar biosynthetic protein FliQ [Armatimonadota bacterium]MDR5689457.1 flagellar biosynthetic protein FliQ [Armatimonadota bacterium]MDR7386640.1 flagellar biosynthetic protein FliQ [Armatimonadota bacterium]MDR7392301.1 flagellar biosynthetic protein FliQ [Armatimonadota bacterium]